MSDFASRLLQARATAGMTQRELADRVGISTVQLSRYEGGRSHPRLPVLVALAKVLNVSQESLAAGRTFEPEVEPNPASDFSIAPPPGGELRAQLSFALSLLDYLANLRSRYSERMTENELKDFQAVKDRVTRMIWKIEDEIGEDYPLKRLDRYISAKEMREQLKGR